MTRMHPRVICAVLLAAASALAQQSPIPQQLLFTPYHSTGIYDVGETVGWTVTPGPVAPTYVYKWTVRANNAVVLKEGKLDLSSGKDKIEITGDQPEMIYVAIEPFTDLATRAPTQAASASAAGSTGQIATAHGDPAPSFVGGNTGRNNGLYAVGAAVAPTRIGLSAPRPDDFDAFWDAKLAAQAKVPSIPSLRRLRPT